MKILMVSDTHRNVTRFAELVDRVGDVDMIFHMGDSERDRVELEAFCDCPLYVVKGNCDYMVDHPREEIVEAGGHRFFLTHGHAYQAKYGPSMLREAAASRQADVVCFGHTHEPCIDCSKEIYVINPGSLCYPRQYDRRATYILAEIDKQGEIHFALNYF